MRVGAYAATLFVSAFLLFFVQPMIARFILPWFGGGTGVWSTCLLFFQGILLLGYLYAYGLSRWLGVREQAVLHSLLLLASIALLPLSLNSASNGQQPTIELLWILARSLGLPCLLISASAPLLQHWFAQRPGMSPYRLYAVSNLGSLLGLVCYPLIIEPNLGLALQANSWSAGFVLLTAGSLLCAGFVVGRHPTPTAAPMPKEASPSIAAMLVWVALSAAGVVLLLSITTELTTNLVPMPLLWVLPLGLYLATFIWSFATGKNMQRRRWLSLFCLLILPTLWLPAATPIVGVWPSVLLSCSCLFAGCMVCHLELARLKPSKRFLSQFYLLLAFGGVVGGAFVNFAAPVIFDNYWELPIALFGILALAGLCSFRSNDGPKRPNPLGLPQRSGTSMAVVALWMLAGTALAFFGTLPLRTQDGTVVAARSFYGRLRVVDTREEGEEQRTLIHGRIRHGSQYLSEERRSEPTLYFSRDSGVGLALQHASKQSDRHVGVIGLGIGTLASYGKDTDRFRFYELDPLVHDFANRYFSFLSDSAASIQTVIGDGRLSLAQEWASGHGNEFDILVVDAFNADAVPTHLLTREAFELYWQHLNDNGTLALNITNTFLQLAPMIAAQAKHLDKQAVLIRTGASEQTPSGSTWILLTDDGHLLTNPAVQAASTPMPAPGELWTDDYSNVLHALK